jgi:hypothetical protein
MDPFLLQLADLCRTERTRSKWVIVPTHALGHTLGEHLGLGGTPWANLRFTTPLDLALQMAAPFLVERGVEPAADEVGPALVMRLLLELPASVPRYFRRLSAPGDDELAEDGILAGEAIDGVTDAVVVEDYRRRL